MNERPLVELHRFSLLADDLDHPEGVAWGLDGFVYAGGEAGQIYRISLEGQVKEIRSTGGYALGLCLDGNGAIHVCDLARRAVLRVTPDGEMTILSDGVDGRRMLSPNYPVFGSDGTLYVSDSGSWNGDDGLLWCIDPQGRTEILRDDVSAFPNGLAIDAGEGYLYVAVSQLPGVMRVPLRAGSGSDKPELVVRLPGTVPDGLAFDSGGTLYISCYAPNVIFALAPTGALAKFAEDPLAGTLFAPTNVAFCGPDLRTLVVANLAGRHLSAVRLDLPGQPCNYPRPRGS